MPTVPQGLQPAQVRRIMREVEFESLEEPGHRVRLEPAHMRAGYVERFGKWQNTLRSECRRQLIDLIEITTDTPFEKGLGAYLQKRRKLY